MKPEETLSFSNSSPKSSIKKLCRKLSPRKLKVDDSGSELQRVFEYFDEDGNGKISAAELRSCVKTVGGELSAEEAEMAVRSSDSDGDGLLGFEDFVKMVEGGGEEELREAFGMYAMEGSGCITPKSLKRMLSRLGGSTTINNCKAMIQTFDINGDGVLDFEEFRLMMRQPLADEGIHQC